MGCASSKEPLGQEDLEYMLEKTNYDEHTIQGPFICNVRRIYSELIQLVIRALVDYSELSLVRMDYVTQKSGISPCMTLFILLFNFVYMALGRKCEQMLIFYSKQPNLLFRQPKVDKNITLPYLTDFNSKSFYFFQDFLIFWGKFFIN